MTPVQPHSKDGEDGRRVLSFLRSDAGADMRRRQRAAALAFNHSTEDAHAYEPNLTVKD